MREVRLLKGKPIEIDYLALKPRIDLWDKYPHISDDDAFISMDSHSAIIYFKSRGYLIKSHKNFLKRVLCRGEAVVIQKPC